MTTTNEDSPNWRSGITHPLETVVNRLHYSAVNGTEWTQFVRDEGVRLVFWRQRIGGTVSMVAPGAGLILIIIALAACRYIGIDWWINLVLGILGIAFLYLTIKNYRMVQEELSRHPFRWGENGIGLIVLTRLFTERLEQTRDRIQEAITWNGQKQASCTGVDLEERVLLGTKLLELRTLVRCYLTKVSYEPYLPCWVSTLPYHLAQQDSLTAPDRHEEFVMVSKHLLELIDVMRVAHITFAFANHSVAAMVDFKEDEIASISASKLSGFVEQAILAFRRANTSWIGCNCVNHRPDQTILDSP